MARKKKPSRTDTARTRATATATVRFAAEHSNLQSLLHDAAGTLQSDLVAADSGARSASHFARAARPHIENIYNAAQGRSAGAQSDVQTAFAGVGAAADPFRAATAREQGGATSRLETARADALGSLTDREQAAVAGGIYSKQAAREKFSKTVSDLQDRLTQLGDKEGAFVTSEMGKILEANANRRAQTRNTRLAAQLRGAQSETDFAHDLAKIDRQAALDAKAAKIKAKADKAAADKKTKKDGGGTTDGGATRAELKGFQGEFEKALRYARQYATKLPRKQLGDKLIKGQRADPTTGAVDIPAFGDQLALSAALDMVYLGYISPTNMRKLHRQRGIRVADLPSAVSQTTWSQRGLVGRNQSSGTPERPPIHGGPN